MRRMTPLSLATTSGFQVVGRCMAFVQSILRPGSSSQGSKLPSTMVHTGFLLGLRTYTIGLTGFVNTTSSRRKWVCNYTSESVAGSVAGAERLLPFRHSVVPECPPPSQSDLQMLHDFVMDSQRLVVLTGAGASTECGIPDYRRTPHGERENLILKAPGARLIQRLYQLHLQVHRLACVTSEKSLFRYVQRFWFLKDQNQLRREFTWCLGKGFISPHGAYSSGFKPMTHQDFVTSEHSRRRYWARSYAGWRRFISAKPGPTYISLAQLESKGRVKGMITQNVDRLQHRAGSTPIELHGTTHEVICLNCGTLVDRFLFQDRVKDLNPEWARAVEALEKGEAGSDASFGMQQRPDGDLEIDEKFFRRENFQIPACQRCSGILKPDVVFFGDNVPKARVDLCMAMARSADALLVVGSSIMTMSAYRLVRAALEMGSPLAILNIGPTRADDLATLKIEARSGETLPRLLAMGSMDVPAS